MIRRFIWAEGISFRNSLTCKTLKKEKKKKGSGMRRLDFNLQIVCHPSLTMTKIRACLVLCYGLFILFCFFKTGTMRIFLVWLFYKHIKKYVPKKTVFGKKNVSFFFLPVFSIKNYVSKIKFLKEIEEQKEIISYGP